MRGIGTIMEGGVLSGANSGSHYCHFCPTQGMGELDQSFTYGPHNTYVLTAFVRSGGQLDASQPALGGGQLFLYAVDAAAYFGRADSIVPLKKVQWTQVQATIVDASVSKRQLIDFYTEPYGANTGDCIDVDDVLLIQNP